MLHTSRPVVALRSMLRSMGLTRFLAKFRYHANYDPKLIQMIQNRLRPQDVVWDIGANIGMYSCALAPHCKEVIAFEPDPWPLERLRAAAPANVRVQAIALSDTRGKSCFRQSTEPLHVTSALCDSSVDAGGDGMIEVQVWPGDEYRNANNLAQANAVKIDVEGYELQVIRGLKNTLGAPSCRTMLVEVHFAQLKKRGITPNDVVAEIRACGFDKPRFPDASHLFATKA